MSAAARQHRAELRADSATRASSARRGRTAPATRSRRRSPTFRSASTRSSTSWVGFAACCGAGAIAYAAGRTAPRSTCPSIRDAARALPAFSRAAPTVVVVIAGPPRAHRLFPPRRRFAASGATGRRSAARRAPAPRRPRPPRWRARSWAPMIGGAGVMPLAPYGLGAWRDSSPGSPRALALRVLDRPALRPALGLQPRRSGDHVPRARVREGRPQPAQLPLSDALLLRAVPLGGARRGGTRSRRARSGSFAAFQREFFPRSDARLRGGAPADGAASAQRPWSRPASSAR